MSSFFRRPGEESSDESSEEEDDAAEMPHVEISRQSSTVDDDLELAPTESLSTNASLSKGDDEDQLQQQALPRPQNHRDLMFATLLEEWCKTRAAELMNTADQGAAYHRLSPEVQGLAQKLFSDAGKTLSTTGVLPSTASSPEYSNVRQKYLAGLDSVSLRTLEEKDLKPSTAAKKLPANAAGNTLALVRAERRGSNILNVLNEPVNSMIMQTGRLSISSPQSDMQLTYSRAHHSHYESSFQQMKLLGKGGFGRVYHAFNVFDRKEYAVKKIPLSHRLSQKYRESGHQELETVLREVQALAELEHSNIVRYHATWIEEPKTSSQSPPLSPPRHLQPIPSVRHTTQKLLDFRPYQTPPKDRLTVPTRPKSRDLTEGIVFGHDHSARRSSHEVEPFANGWSQSFQHQDSSSVRESEIFTDGQGRSRTGSIDTSIDSSVYVLHVQMSMYPMTLAQYLSPMPADSTSAPGSPPRRHCFHLVPSLKILLGILCGLQYIHAKGLIHRDIKPGNIFLSTLTDSPLISDGFYDMSTCVSCPRSEPLYLNPRIGDFGLVADLARSAAQTHHGSPPASKPVGTEYYRPPASDDEKVGGKSGHITVNEKLDVFALGVILVELLWSCGTAFERSHVLMNLQKGRLPKSLGTKIDAEGHEAGTGLKVEGCIKGMLDKDPTQRWPCQRVKECLESILGRCQIQSSDVQMNKIQSL